MRFAQDEIDLTTLFKEVMDADYTTMPVDWPGMTTKPSGLHLRFRVSRVPDSRFVATNGATKSYRNYGSVLLQIIGPIGNGPGAVLGVADTLSLALRGKRIGGLRLKTPSAGGTVEEKTTIAVTVSVPYVSDFKVDSEGNLIP